MSKFEIGPLQYAWLTELRAHPELQTTDILGFKRNEEEGYCCLGLALICIHKNEGTELVYSAAGNLLDCNSDNDFSNTTLSQFEKIGLRSNIGTINMSAIPYKERPSCSNLAELNDDGWSWPQIADFIEKYPEAVFTRSV